MLGMFVPSVVSEGIFNGLELERAVWLLGQEYNGLVTAMAGHLLAMSRSGELELEELDVQAMRGSEGVDWAQALALKVFIRLEKSVAVLEEAIPLA